MRPFWVGIALLVPALAMLWLSSLSDRGQEPLALGVLLLGINVADGLSGRRAGPTPRWLLVAATAGLGVLLLSESHHALSEPATFLIPPIAFALLLPPLERRLRGRSLAWWAPVALGSGLVSFAGLLLLGEASALGILVSLGILGAAAVGMIAALVALRPAPGSPHAALAGVLLGSAHAVAWAWSYKHPDSLVWIAAALYALAPSIVGGLLGYDPAWSSSPSSPAPAD